MKAIVSRHAGGPESLSFEEIAPPLYGPGDLLIAVEACGVNYPDALLIEDRYQIKVDRPFSPGGEVCGFVVSIGPDVEGFELGDRVIGRCGWGGMAEKVAIPASKCVQIDTHMPAEEAATFLFAYATAYHALRQRGMLNAEESVLVLGAAGGVGSAAVELATAFGARVFAGVSSADKLRYARQIGAVDGIVYPSGLEEADVRSLGVRFKELAGPGGINLIFDPVGGFYSEAALRSLSRGGRHLVVGFTAGIPRMPLNLALLKSCQIIGVDWRSFNLQEPALSASNVSELLSLYKRGLIRPTISQRFPLEQGAEAIRQLRERKAVGRVVVTVSSRAEIDPKVGASHGQYLERQS